MTLSSKVLECVLYCSSLCFASINLLFDSFPVDSTFSNETLQSTIQLQNTVTYSLDKMSFDDMQFDLAIVQEMFPNLTERDIRSIRNAHPRADLQELMDIWLNENTRKSESREFIQTKGGDFSPKVERYKLDPCPDYECHLGSCQFYHNFNDRRRDPEKFEYQPKPCVYVETYGTWKDPRGCKKRDSCGFCHTENELQYHPRGIPKEQNELQRHTRGIPKEQNESQHHPRGIPKEQNRNGHGDDESVETKIQRLKEEEAKLTRDIEEMKKANLCAVCEGANFAVVYAPCYHPICFMCNYKTNSRCLKCKSYIEEIHKKPHS